MAKHDKTEQLIERLEGIQMAAESALARARRGELTEQKISQLAEIYRVIELAMSQAEVS